MSPCVPAALSFVAAANDRGTAYMLGWLFGMLLCFGIPAALVLWVVMWRSRRRSSDASPAAPVVGRAGDAVWDGRRWLRWDGTRWWTWDGAAWRAWDGSAWVAPASPAPGSTVAAPDAPPRPEQER